MYIKATMFVTYFLIQVNARNMKTYQQTNYEMERLALLSEESKLAVGGTIKLNEAEKSVNAILMSQKHIELDTSFWSPADFNLSKHYFSYREDIGKSKVYQIIRMMPKGAALHIHSSMMLDVDVLIRFTYEPNLYICSGDQDFSLTFSLPPITKPCKHEWALLNVVRSMSENITRFDDDLKQFFALHAQDPKDFINIDINKVWSKFKQVYYAIKNIISYRPIREKFIYESLKNFYEDNVMYVELRTGILGLYELNGTIHDRKYLLELYKRVTDKFIEDHPDFIGIKLIITRDRKQSEKQIEEAIDIVKSFKEEIPNMIAGFDLVGQEDLGKPLSEFLPVLFEAKDKVDYFFHAGETDWYGMPSDENLYDAVLLGAKRIGHAYALIKHPILIQAILKKNIAIEVNVISNNVLSLVNDIRNHPLASYLAMGLPVVLSSDDPGAWGADPMSHDFYVAFMGVASRNADLRLLKQLAYNSIEYSSLEEDRKHRLKQIFETHWENFIKNVIQAHSIHV